MIRSLIWLTGLSKIDLFSPQAVVQVYFFSFACLNFSFKSTLFEFYIQYKYLIWTLWFNQVLNKNYMHLQLFENILYMYLVIFLNLFINLLIAYPNKNTTFYILWIESFHHNNTILGNRILARNSSSLNQHMFTTVLILKCVLKMCLNKISLKKNK